MGLFNVKKQLTDDCSYFRAGVSWDEKAENPFDVDVSAFLLDSDGKANDDNDFVFFNNGFSADGSVIYGGDNRTGHGDGFDENILVKLDKLSSSVHKMVFCITINKDERECTFGEAGEVVFSADQIPNEYEKYGHNVAAIRLDSTFPTSHCTVVCELIRSGAGWILEIKGENIKGGLAELCVRYGLELE